ncbi:MAG: hypothetical protein BWY78_00075 [Alphaproteobacteria bacterium ADurb.Bin438]|nr:MAG: hypothetical protein BWY78_00075 [Alphaproteobacteria bacterium ADurb.Bin438]
MIKKRINQQIKYMLHHDYSEEKFESIVMKALDSDDVCYYFDIGSDCDCRGTKLEKAVKEYLYKIKLQDVI